MTASIANLASYDATDVARAIRAGELSSIEVVEAFFERIESLNPGCNAFVTLDKANAMRRAEAADEALKAGETWGPLHGVPVSIKDAFDTAGIRTTAGFSSYSDFVPTEDAFAVDRLKNAGAIVLGKTNCATLCLDAQTTNPIFGTTNNPWDRSRTSGGSSGGEAVAIAMGLSPLGIGSDTAGSIRIPSSYCGVYGFKPTVGKIALNGLKPLNANGKARADSMTVVGPMAKSMRDLILCYEVLSGEQVPVSERSGARAEPLKVLYTDRFDLQSIADEVVSAVRDSFDRLVSAGAEARKVVPPINFSSINKHYMSLCMYEFIPKDYSPGLHRIFWAFEALKSLFRGGTEGRYQAIKKSQADLSAAFEAFLDSCDCWVFPATPVVAFRHQKTGWPVPMKVNGKLRKRSYYEAAIGLTAPISFLGNPSVVIPIGRTEEGLPIAVQVVGKRGADAKLLRDASYIASIIGVDPSFPETTSA